MASRSKLIHQRVDRPGDRQRAETLSDHRDAGHRTLLHGFCAVCFLEFGSQEKKVFWGEKAAHPSCARRLGRSIAA